MKKHILCIGDSNTHGYCAEPFDCADGGDRFNEEERWTCLLGNHLGSNYLVLEEGLGGRTSVFQDPLTEGMCCLDVLFPIMMSHKPLDLLIIMLGTNDTKERFGVTSECISVGIERLINKAKTIDAWKDNRPNILLIAPPHILEEMCSGPFYGIMGAGCVEKSRELAFFYKAVADRTGCHFLDAEDIAEFNLTDGMHLTRKGHAALADHLASIVPKMVTKHEE